MQSVMREISPNDYGALLERVIGSLPDRSREARESVYARARTMLASHFRASVSQASPINVERETNALEAAIRRIEADFATHDVSARKTSAMEAAAPASGRSVAADETDLRLAADVETAREAAPGGAGQFGGRSPSTAVGETTLGGRVGGQLFARPTKSPGAPSAVPSARSPPGGRTSRIDPTLPAILEFQRPSAAIVNAPVPRSARGIAWVITSMALALIVATGIISVDQVVTAKGIVISESPTILVQPLETAIVRSIEVSEGQQVHAGDVLAKLDSTFAAADLSTLTTQISSLSAEAARLHAEAAGQQFAYAGDKPDWLLQLSIFNHRQAEFQLRMENYKDKIDELTSVVARATSDSSGYDARAQVATHVEQIRKELEARELGSRLNTLAASDARAEMERARANAEETIQSAERDLAALKAERDGFAQNWSADVGQKQSENNGKLAEAREQLSKAELRRKLVEIRADKDSIVQSLAKVSVGSVLQSGQPFITLVPIDASLEVEANIPGDENGFVHVGDPVAIKFDTLPYAQYGMAEGNVRIVSPNSFTAQEEARNPTSALPVQSTTQPFYRARVSIDRVALRDTPNGFRLMPGMPVTADVMVGKRTVLNYLIGRVVPIVKEGMREP
jgi:HlyD family secretion protein